MKNRLTIPTILGFIILLVGTTSGVLLINSRQNFKLGANVEAIPKNVRISNIADSSFSVTWITNTPSKGFVKWGENRNAISKVVLEESMNNEEIVHMVNITGVKPNSNIFFKINSNGKDYDNNGLPWQTKTLGSKPNSSNNLIATGSVLQSNASTPARAIIHVVIDGVSLAALTSNEGNFILPVSKYIENVPEDLAINLSVDGGSSGSATAVIYANGLKAIPVIVLGKTYDFRSLISNQSGEIPQSSVSIPQESEGSSRFEVTQIENGNQFKEVKIESIDDNEIITTKNPEFFGSGPTNTEIEISVESELQTAIISTSQNGKWKWNPSNDLEPGEHKLTIKWRDAQGILRTITRTFIVQAAEGPAFESTPSATPTNSGSPAATNKPSLTPTAKSSTPSATLAPTPETGSLTPTVGLFILSLGLILTGFFIYKKNI